MGNDRLEGLNWLQRQYLYFKTGATVGFPIINIIFSALLFIPVLVSPDITMIKDTNMIQTLANACITISAINTAAILAAIAFLIGKIHKILIKTLFVLLGFSVLGTFLSLYCLFSSFFIATFGLSIVKNLNINTYHTFQEFMDPCLGESQR